MHLSITHTTRYSFDSDAGYSIQSLRLTPPDFDGQEVRSWDVSIPGASLETSGMDSFGNELILATISEPHDHVIIEARGEVIVADRNGIVRGLPELAPKRTYLRETALTVPDDDIRDLAASIDSDSELDRLHELASRIDDRLEFDVGATHSETTAAEALTAGRGVCQDFAQLFISCARSLGVPARYVTGYLVVDDELHAEAHHAWAEAWVPNLGWVGFDVANARCPTDHYVRLACGLDASSAAPVRGSRQGGDTESLAVRVVVDDAASQQ